MASIRHLCKSGVVLENGQVAFIGTANDAIDRYMASNSNMLDDTPICEFPRPKGCNGDVRFTSIAFLNKDNQPITPHSGGFVRIQLGIEVSKDVEKCRLSLDLFSQSDSLLMTFPSSLVKGDMQIKRGTYYANCDVERLPLTGGSYKLSLWAADEKGTSDFIEMAVPMDVQDDDFFKTGKVQTASHMRGKVVLSDYQWNLVG